MQSHLEMKIQYFETMKILLLVKLVGPVPLRRHSVGEFEHLHSLIKKRKSKPKPALSTLYIASAHRAIGLNQDRVIRSVNSCTHNKFELPSTQVDEIRNHLQREQRQRRKQRTQQ